MPDPVIVGIAAHEDGELSLTPARVTVQPHHAERSPASRFECDEGRVTGGIEPGEFVEQRPVTLADRLEKTQPEILGIAGARQPLQRRSVAWLRGRTRIGGRTWP